MVNFETLKLAVKQCYQSGQFLKAANTKIRKLKCDILSNLQTMWMLLGKNAN